MKSTKLRGATQELAAAAIAVSPDGYSMRGSRMTEQLGELVGDVLNPRNNAM